jgi:hypothetical protein
MKSINLYKFNELDQNAKKNALSWWQDNREPRFDDYPIIEGITEDLEALSIEDVDIKYSGFWSQGDGLSFTGRVYDTMSFLGSIPEAQSVLNGLSKDTLELINDSVEINFDRISSRYLHENTAITILFAEWQTSETFNLLPKLEEVIEIWRLNKCSEFYNRLEEYYNECTSEQAVQELLDDRETEEWTVEGAHYTA